MKRLHMKNGLHVTEKQEENQKLERELKKRLENHILVEEW